MQPQVRLVLVALCALLACACTSGEDGHATIPPLRIEPLMLDLNNNSSSGVDQPEKPEPYQESKGVDQPEKPEPYQESEGVDQPVEPEPYQEPKEMSEDNFKELCQSPSVVGPCRAAFQRWFFDQTKGSCEKFIYGGCKGNKNNYETKELCRSTCSGVKLLSSKKVQPVMSNSDDDKDECTAPADTGPCRALMPSFYFDPESQSCKTFVYGGCRGNGNRYGTENECMERCLSTGSSEGRGQVRNRWTAAFFLFLTLGAVSFLLLTALIFITMRRHRGPRPALSIRSDKEGLLPDSERSSVDSLPLPESPTRQA